MTTYQRARELDEADPLGRFRDRFLKPDGVVAYFDGNSLGRPPASTYDSMDAFIRDSWGTRLIRGWDDGWTGWPETVGDEIGAAVVGAAAGQVVVADSTTVLLYKLCRAAVDARPGRREVVLDTDNFPTDRFVLEGIAAERGLTLRWIETDPTEGVHPGQVARVVGPETALVVFSHVAYRSGFVADVEAITRIAHDAGALALWDLSHSAGSVPVLLDGWDVDLAVGCTYKYLNAGPGAPAFAYVRRDLHDSLQQPIWGWMGGADIFEMGPAYRPAAGVRRFVSGTPPILAMIPVRVGVEMVAEAGIEAIRAKSMALTRFALKLTDAWLVDLGVEVASPRDPGRRGGHLTICRPDFRSVNAELWKRGVIPDFRAPDGIRIGLSPLSTSFEELFAGMAVIRDVAAGE